MRRPLLICTLHSALGRAEGGRLRPWVLRPDVKISNLQSMAQEME